MEYPRNAVCDPASSGYGPDTWKMRCVTLTKPITMTGKVWVDDGMTFVDVGPDIRFDPSKDVYMSVKIKDIMHQRPRDDWQDRYGIWYTWRVGDERFYINDAANNPELSTVFETTRKGDATGWMTRKIWHFSGYYVRAGKVCDSDCDEGNLQ